MNVNDVVVVLATFEYLSGGNRCKEEEEIEKEKKPIVALEEKMSFVS